MKITYSETLYDETNVQHDYNFIGRTGKKFKSSLFFFYQSSIITVI